VGGLPGRAEGSRKVGGDGVNRVPVIGFVVLFFSGAALVLHAAFRVIFLLCRALFEPDDGGVE
jgi:hypothetical protein